MAGSTEPALCWKGPHRHYVVLRVDAPDHERYRRVLHEYVHLLTHANVPGLPPWLDEGIYMVSGARVSLDSIVSAFFSGQSAESIAQAFPVLTLEQVYGGIAFYLAHRNELDRYLDARRRGFERQREAARNADPMFYQKLADARKRSPLAR